MTPEHILFGSDYPHPEGLAEPFEWAEEVSNLYPPAAVQKIMGGNMFELIGLKVAGLTDAAEVGWSGVREPRSPESLAMEDGETVLPL